MLSETVFGPFPKIALFCALLHYSFVPFSALLRSCICALLRSFACFCERPRLGTPERSSSEVWGGLRRTFSRRGPRLLRSCFALGVSTRNSSKPELLDVCLGNPQTSKKSLRRWFHLEVGPDAVLLIKRDRASSPKHNKMSAFEQSTPLIKGVDSPHPPRTQIERVWI